MDKKSLEDLVNQRLSIVRIGEVLGKSPGGIRYWLKFHGLKTITPSNKHINVVEYESLTEHKCKKCNEIKPISEFYKTKRRGGKNVPYSYCKDCSVKRIRENHTIPYKEFAVEYKGGKCEKCGYSKCLSALEFHHKDPSEKDFSISQMISWKGYTSKSKELMKKELDKCALLCSNCHREVHSGLIKI